MLSNGVVRHWLFGSPLAQAELSIDKDPELLAMLKDSSVNAQVSMIIYDVRKQAGLTQRQLADLVGTTRSAHTHLPTTTAEPLHNHHNP
jgi:hypothetical protein